METITTTDRQRIIKRMMQDHEMNEGRAAATFDQTLAFLATAAHSPGERLRPTPEVDKGWHTFLLYTKAYRKFCRSQGREFIDHEPDDLPERVVTQRRLSAECEANCACGTEHEEDIRAHCGVNCKTGCDSITLAAA